MKRTMGAKSPDFALYTAYVQLRIERDVSNVASIVRVRAANAV